MQTKNELCSLLAEKKDAFLHYEKETAALLTCGIEEFEKHMESRKKLADTVDGLDAKIAQITADCKEHQNEIDRAIKNRCARNQLSPELQPVFDAAQQIFAVIHRIQRMESSVEERIKYEQKILLEKIKNLNRSNTAKASKFYGTAGIADRNQFFSNHSKKV